MIWFVQKNTLEFLNLVKYLAINLADKFLTIMEQDVLIDIYILINVFYKKNFKSS